MTKNLKFLKIALQLSKLHNTFETQSILISKEPCNFFQKIYKSEVNIEFYV